MTLDDIRRLNIREVGNWPLLPRIVLLLADLRRDRWSPARCSTGRTSTRSSSTSKQEEAKLQGAVRDQEGEGDQLRPLRPAAEGDRAVVRRAAEAAAEQGRDGRAADRHQPGRTRSRPAVRAVQARGAGADRRLLRRAADHRADHRQLSRHGRVRERRRAAAAHRHAERRRRSRTTRASSTMDAVAKTFRYLDEDEVAKQRKAAKDAKDKEKAKK